MLFRMPSNAEKYGIWIIFFFYMFFILNVSLASLNWLVVIVKVDWGHIYIISAGWQARRGGRGGDEWRREGLGREVLEEYQDNKPR